MVSVPIRRWPLVLTLLAAASAKCVAAETGETVRPFRDGGLVSQAMELPATIARALNRIRNSSRDYQLTEDLWFEKLPENLAARGPAFESTVPKNLMEIADTVFDTHRLSWRNALTQGLDLNVQKNEKHQYRLDITRQDVNNIPATRTFGLQRRRLQMIMLPVMYKLGVITTLLTGLTVLSLKGVTIGVVLLMLAVASIVSKVSKYHHPYGGPPWSVHDPYDRSSLQQHQPHSQDKNIHVHVHTAPGAVPPPPRPWRSSPSSAHDVQSDDAGAYWNRVSEDYGYYDGATMNRDNDYYQYRYRPTGDAESTTAADSVYRRWLG